MRHAIRAVTLLLALSAAVAGCGSSPSSGVAGALTSPQAGLPIGTLTIEAHGSKTALSVEVAETESTRQIGLMGRSNLPPDAGMVFLFPDLHEGGFWMKDTLIPLSIAFWDSQGRIVGILDMEPCEADPCPLYAPQGPYAGAVETNLGYFEAQGARVGDLVELKR